MSAKSLAIGLALALMTHGVVAAAPAFSEPKALLEYAYQPYEDGVFSDDPLELYSSNLRALVYAEQARKTDAEIGALDFDPFINAQDFGDLSVKIGEPFVKGNLAKTEVRVDDSGDEQHLIFSLVLENGSWRIDDIESITPEQEWRLSELLAPNPLEN